MTYRPVWIIARAITGDLVLVTVARLCQTSHPAKSSLQVDLEGLGHS